jgi:hypothetical protein
MLMKIRLLKLNKKNVIEILPFPVFFLIQTKRQESPRQCAMLSLMTLAGNLHRSNPARLTRFSLAFMGTRTGPDPGQNTTSS